MTDYSERPSQDKKESEKAKPLPLHPVSGRAYELDLEVTRSSFCGSARKVCGWLAGWSRKIRLRFSNVRSIGLSVRSSSC